MTDATKTRNQSNNMPGNRSKHEGHMEDRDSSQSGESTENQQMKQEQEKEVDGNKNREGQHNRGSGYTDRPTPGQDEETV